MTANATLQRTTFTTSRLLEFFSEKELSMQIGHESDWWPLALLKELVDNALDACEMAGESPVIEVDFTEDTLSVRDNGPGIPATTVEHSLDYLVRVSDKAHYVSPTRGQLGNALKCVWAAPYVATGEEGRVEIEAQGVHHDVVVSLDRIAQQPALSYHVRDGVVRKGAFVKIHWPGIAGYLVDSDEHSFPGVPHRDGKRLLAGYAAFNPHAAFTWCEERVGSTSGAEWRKWRPGDATSPHWYTPERLRDLIAAYVTAEVRDGARARTVREFVSEFQGLSGTAKQKTVTTAADLAGAYLHDLVVDDDVDVARTAGLLTAMQEESRAPRPSALGILGTHLTDHMAKSMHVAAESVRYKKVEGTAEGLPFVLETALGVYAPDSLAYGRDVKVGLNWTPALRSPMRELTALLGEQRVDPQDPVAVLVHLSCPRLQFIDRGKGLLDLQPEIREALETAFRSVSKTWKTAKRKADKEDRVQQRDLDRLRSRYQEVSIKEAAYEVMEQAYLAASADGTLPANARQIMYAARPLVLEITGGKCWRNASYFTQHLLHDFMEEHPGTEDWNVVMDARGHFHEPHTDRQVNLGTLGVRHYVGSWQGSAPEIDLAELLPGAYPTSGPTNRFRHALLVEKEGFNPLLQAARLAERFDLAIMSTKGMSSTAARELVDRLSEQGVTILVLHDFDKAGFSIVNTLRTDSRRYQFDTLPNVVDLGLRLGDVEALGLASERVDYPGGVDPRFNLLDNGATADECDFLVRWRIGTRYQGERVELNAMMAGVFVRFLEAKFAEHGVGKLVPDLDGLQRAYQRAVGVQAMRRGAATALASLRSGDLETPPDLAAEVARRVAGQATSWDAAVWDIVHEGRSE